MRPTSQQFRQLGEVRRHAAGLVAGGSEVGGNGPTCAPSLAAGRFPQEKIFEDKLPVAGSKRSTANSARYVTVNGLPPGFGFYDLI
jgi:hypothetical protein